MRTQVILIDSVSKRDRASAWLAKVPCDEVLELELRPYKATRSQQANRRYWAIVGKAADHTGHDKDDLHEIFKAKFLGRKVCDLSGEQIEAQRSSARLNVREFREYMERVETWCVETLGVWLE